MFTLSFIKSGSQQYSTALSCAEKIGCVTEGDTTTLELSDMKLLCSYEYLCDLLKLIHKWKGVEATYRGKEVNPFRFIFTVWRNIKTCSEWKYGTRDPKHCWKDPDTEGWGCKHLAPFKRELSGDGQYKRSNQFWYNYGNREGMYWKISKGVILDKLIISAQAGHLLLCPHFSLERLKDIVDSLPDRVPIDGTNFKPFKKDARIVNIRHSSSHFAFTERITFDRETHYADMCLINYISHLENKMNYYEISKN